MNGNKADSIERLEEESKKKDIMIDWLCEQLQRRCSMAICLGACPDFPKRCHNHKWREHAEKIAAGEKDVR